EPQRDDDAERKCALLGVVRDLVKALPEDVAEEHERGAPQARADDVVRDEAPQRHLRRARDERRDRADEADEAPDQDRLATVAVEEALDLLEALMRDLDPRPVLLHEFA